LFFTFLIASKPAPVGDLARFVIVSSADAIGAAISSGPPREPGGGKSGSLGARLSISSILILP